MNDLDIKPVANFNFTIDDLSSEEQVAFYQHWLELKGDKVMPARSDFDPINVPKLLPFLSLEDVEHDPVRFQVRLVGTKTSSLQTAKGLYLDEIDGTEEIVIMLKEMVRRKEPYFYISNVKWDERRYKTYSSLIVPFSDDGERVTLAMACHCTISINKYEQI